MKEKSNASAEETRDRFLIWPLALALGWPLFAMLASIAPLYYGLILVGHVAMFWIASAIPVLLIACGGLKRRTWRRFLSAIIFPVLTLAAAANYDVSWRIIRSGGEIIHLWAMMPSYRLEIAKLPKDQGPRTAYFSWGGWLTDTGAYYDESDEIARPAGERSAAWSARHADCPFTRTIPAGLHFYVVEIAC